MTKKIGYQEDSLVIGLELATQGAVLGLAFAISATALAPVLPPDVKGQINQSLGTDLDAAHMYWEYKIIEAGHFVGKLLEEFQGIQQFIPQKDTEDKCKTEEEFFQIGQWVFTIPSRNCQ